MSRDGQEPEVEFSIFWRVLSTFRQERRDASAKMRAFQLIVGRWKRSKSKNVNFASGKVRGLKTSVLTRSLEGTRGGPDRVFYAKTGKNKNMITSVRKILEALLKKTSDHQSVTKACRLN